MIKNISKYTKYDAAILELHKKGYNNSKIAKLIGIDGRRVSDRLKANNVKAYGNINKEVFFKNKEQEQVFLGTVLGDGCLFKCEKSINYRFNLAHSLKQKQYFLYKYNVLKSLSLPNYKELSTFDKRTEKIYHKILVQSRTNILYTKLYKRFYKKGKKIINKHEAYLLEPLTIAIIYYDDGYHLRGAGCFSMCDFDSLSIKNFRSVLFNKYDIETTLQKNNIVYVPKKQFIKFKFLIHQYATPDVLYKLGLPR